MSICGDFLVRPYNTIPGPDLWSDIDFINGNYFSEKFYYKTF